MIPAQTAPADAGPSKSTRMGETPLSAQAEPGSLHALILDSLEDDQAQDVVSIPLEGKSSIADHMIVASGRSTRQVASISTQSAAGNPSMRGLPWPAPLSRSASLVAIAAT